MFQEIVLLSIIVISMIIGFSDILTRKVKNSMMLLFAFLSISYALLFSQNYVVSLIALSIIILIAYILYYFSIWGAADGKYFILSSLVVLSLGELYHYAEFIINALFLFALGSIVVGVSNSNITYSKKLISTLPYKLYFYQSLVLLACSSIIIFLFYELIENIFVLFSLLVIVLFIVNRIVKRLYRKLDINSNIVIGFIAFCYGFYELFGLYPLTLLGVFIVKNVLGYLNEIAQDGMNHKKFGFSSPIVAYFAFALIFQISSNQSIISFLFSFFT